MSPAHNPEVGGSAPDAVLPGPTITSPGTATDTGFTTASTTPTMTWNQVSGASGYGLFISKYPYGSSNIIYENTDLAGTSITLPAGTLQNGVKYKWNMTTFNSTGVEGSVGNSLYFQTPTAVLPGPTITSPGTATDTGFTTASTTPTMNWNQVSGASGYGLFISKYPYGSSNIIYQNTSLAGTSFTLPAGTLQNGVKYKWNMTTFNSTGVEGSVGNSLYFQTPGATPGTPVTSGPGDTASPGPVLTDLTPTFSWTAVANATRYELNLLNIDTGTFVLDELSISGGSTTSYTPSSNLPAGTRFKWDMRAFNGTVPSGYATDRYFQTQGALTVPDLTAHTIGLSASSVNAGGVVTISYTLENLGSAAPQSQTKISLVNPNNVTQVLTSVSFVEEGIGAATTSARSHNIAIPVGALPGTYQVRLFVDNQSNIGQTNETNDIVSGPSLAVVTPSAGTPGQSPVELGVLWNPSPYYSSRNGQAIDSIVIHTAEGRDTHPDMTYQESYQSAISWFKDNPSEVSAHYVISPTGEITQMVALGNRAHHATYYNARSIGIEMAGFANDSGTWNPQNLAALKKLVAWLVDTYDIQVIHPSGNAYDYTNNQYDAPGLVAHSQIQPWNKSDPGSFFPWSSFVNEVQALVTGTPVIPPTILVTSPNGGEELFAAGASQMALSSASLHQGSTPAISWVSTSNPGPFVKIELFMGTVLDRIIDALTPNDGLFEWSIPPDLPQRSDYSIRVSSTTISGCGDQSDGTFAVVPPTQEPDTLYVDGFDYPIGDRGYLDPGTWRHPRPIAEFPLRNGQPVHAEANGFYSSPTVFLAVDSPDRDKDSDDNWPLITGQWFNMQDTGAFYEKTGIHVGEDWNQNVTQGDMGQPVYASATGRVLSIAPVDSGASTSGWLIVLEHFTAANAELPAYYSSYLHLAPTLRGGLSNTSGLIPDNNADFQYQVGQWVQRGEQLGVIAATTAFGSHLHFDLRRRVRTLPQNVQRAELYAGDGSDGRPDNVYYTSGLQPGETMTQSQVAVAYARMAAEGFLDPSDFIDANRPSLVKNGCFSGNSADWNIGGPGSISLVEDQATGDYRAVATTGSPVMLGQVLSTPRGRFSTSFDYQFLTTTGTLELWLDSVLLASLEAPPSLLAGPSHMSVPVNDPALMGLEGVLFDFRFDGPTGSQVAIRDVQMTPAVVQTPQFLSISNDTGTPGDRVTSDRTLVLHGTAEPGMLLALYRAGILIGNPTADSSGAWTLDYTGTVLADGLHAFSATAQDAFGTVSDMAPPLSVLIVDPAVRNVVLTQLVTEDTLVLQRQSSSVALYVNSPSTGTPTFIIPNAEFDRIDLGSHKLLVASSDEATVREWVKTGWLFSSQTIGTPPVTGLGYMSGSDYMLKYPGELFGGQVVHPTDILIRNTYQGDANFDGQVNFSDFQQLLTGYNRSSNWFSGDFNLSGNTDFSDFQVLLSTYGRGVSSPLAAPGAALPEAPAGVDLAGAPVTSSAGTLPAGDPGPTVRPVPAPRAAQALSAPRASQRRVFGLWGPPPVNRSLFEEPMEPWLRSPSQFHAITLVSLGTPRWNVSGDWLSRWDTDGDDQGSGIDSR